MSVDPQVVKGVIGKAKVVLTNKQFKYFQAHYQGELDVPEIAKMYDVSKGTVYRTLQRARKTMRDNWR